MKKISEIGLVAGMQGILVAQQNRYLCKAKIDAHYPTHKQLNLLRSGTKAEKDKMDAFINACRDWSNGENPDPAVLEAIQP